MYTECGVRVDKMIDRLVKYAPRESLRDLNEIRLLDKDPTDVGIARYFREDKRIELYISDLVGWMPWILKKTYLFPYSIIAHAFGHELDHHVRRDDHLSKADYEKSADVNSRHYTFPSFGIFKPLVKLVIFILKKKRRAARTGKNESARNESRGSECEYKIFGKPFLSSGALQLKLSEAAKQPSF
jgi:hypothetical protein